MLYILLLFSIGATAQHSLKKAEKLFAEYSYPEAARAYADYLSGRVRPDDKTVWHIADTYYYINDFATAERWYKQLYKKQGDAFPAEAFTNYIGSLKAQRKYAESDALLEARYTTHRQYAALQLMRRQKEHIDSLAKQPSHYAISHLSNNSPLADFGAVVYGSRVVYSSARDTVGTGGKLYKWNSQPFLKLYVADRHADNGSLFGDREFLPKSQTGYHNAAACFTADGTTIYFSTNTVKKKNKLVNDGEGTNNLRIMRGTIADGKLTGVISMPFNSQNYSVSHPALSPDGQWLYFVSDMPGGYGGTDIYRVKIEGDSYGKPQNLGSIINTPEKEMFPFLQDGKLYFASDGHYGLGGLDIFETQIGGESYSEPENMGAPLNGNRDDFAFVIDSAGTKGYFSSNREGGRGDDDIYAFRKETPPCSRLMKGVIVDERDNNAPVKSVEVRVYKNAELVAVTSSGDDGGYAIEVPCLDDLTVETVKDGYSSGRVPVALDGNPLILKAVDYNDLVRYERGAEKVIIEPIFFDFDKHNINAQAAAELDKVVYVLQKFPSVIIKIESHTDSRGDDDYNLRLSAARAKSTYDYILSKGIPAKRVESVMGYGETRLINDCGNNSHCTEQEHLSNRRSEFIIVRK